MQGEIKPRAHAVTLENREALRVTGVEAVACLNEEVVELATVQGLLTVSGAGLNMSALDLAQGRVEISGRIDALEYAGQPAGRREGLLGRLFR